MLIVSAKELWWSDFANLLTTSNFLIIFTVLEND